MRASSLGNFGEVVRAKRSTALPVIHKEAPPSPFPTQTALGITLVLLVCPIISFSVLTSLPDNMWEDDTGTWGRVRNSSYCEPSNDATPSVREPINSWTNVAFLVVAVLIGTDAARVRDARRRAFLVLLACVMAGLGVSSFYFHASFVKAWREADITFTKMGPVVLLGFSLSNLLPERVWPVVFLVTLACVGVSSVWSAVFTFATTVSLTTILELGVRPVYKSEGFFTQTWWIAVFALSCFVLAFVVRELEVSGPLCLHSVWFQPHSVWHVANAIAVRLVGITLTDVAILEVRYVRAVFAGISFGDSIFSR